MTRTNTDGVPWEFGGREACLRGTSLSMHNFLANVLFCRSLKGKMLILYENLAFFGKPLSNKA